MALVEIKVPDIGDFDEVTVIELMVKVGDTIKLEQSLITVESDKASMEIPSSHAGVVKELKVNLGDKVAQGSLVLVLEVEGAGAGADSGAVAPAPFAQAPAAAAPAATAAPATAPGNVVAGPIELRIPDIGDFKDVTVIEIFVQVGDTVKVEQSLITVESDKAAMEIPSSHAGVIKELKIKVGDKVNIGDLLGLLEGVAAAAPADATAAATVATSPSVRADPVEAPVSTSSTRTEASIKPTEAGSAPVEAAHNPTSNPIGLPHASPSVRKFARELGVPLDEVKGQGPKGRITQEDVQGFTKAVMSGATQTKAQAATAPKGNADSGAALGLIPWPKVDFAKFGAVERKDLSRIKKISGANLHRNWVMIPHVTNND